MSINHLDPEWLRDLEHAVEYVSLIDADDKLLYVNHANDLPESITGRSVYDFVEPAYHEALQNAVAAARETGNPQHYNSYAVNKDGERSHYSNWVVAMHTGTGKVNVAFIATDVTELSRVEEELQLSDSTLRSLIESSPDTIFIIDRNLEIVYASRLEHGFDSSQVIGLKADQFIPKDDLPSAITLFEQTINTGEIMHYETSIETPEGTKRFSARIAPILNHKQVDRVMVVVTDVTERYIAEAEQKRLQEHLQQAQKMEAIGQLTGGIAHDFNNLLLTIGGNLELALASLSDPQKTQNYLTDALAGVQRGRDLNQQLLAFSRRQPLSPEILEIGSLIADMNSLLRRTLGENIQVTVDIEGSKGHLCCVDRTQLENAVLNLALNARDAMPNGGELTVTTNWLPAQQHQVGDDHPGFIHLTISDTGMGMSEDTLNQSAQPFFTTKQVGEGSGLGLSMVYGFVQQSGGEIRIHSELGKGTTVELDLPCVKGSIQPEVGIEIDETLPQGTGELILLVEDEQSVRDLTAKMLEGLGYQTLTAVNAATGLDLLSQYVDIDLLITDIVMPGELNGYDLANHCRETRPGLPIILVSGHPLERDLSQQSDQWSGHLLQKPYRISELANFVFSKLSNVNKPIC